MKTETDQTPVCMLQDATCFDERLLFHVITERYHFLVSCYFEIFSSAIVTFFETSVLKDVRILCHLHNNSAVPIP